MYDKEYLKGYDKGVTDAKTLTVESSSHPNPLQHEIFEKAARLAIRSALIGDLDDFEFGYVTGFDSVMSNDEEELHTHCTCGHSTCATNKQEVENIESTEDYKRGWNDAQIVAKAKDFKEVKRTIITVLDIVEHAIDGTISDIEERYLDGFADYVASNPDESTENKAIGIFEHAIGIKLF